jgi:hypothetical protein
VSASMTPVEGSVRAPTGTAAGRTGVASTCAATAESSARPTSGAR